MLPYHSPRALANISSLSFAPTDRLFLPPSRSLLFCFQLPSLALPSPYTVVVLPSSLQLGPSVSLWPSLPLAHKARCDAVPLSRVEVWQHRGSGCASRALSPRGGDCGKILMPLTTPLAAAAADDDDDDGAQPAATGAGTNSRDFLLSRSRRVSRDSAKNVSLGRREEILRRQSISAHLNLIYHRFFVTDRRILHS